MPTFVMLTQLSHGALQSPSSLENLNEEVKERVRRDCPEITWLSNYVTLGSSDYLDIFTAPDMAAAMKLATVIRTFGHARIEIWPAIEWKEFLELVRYLPPAKQE